MRPPYYLTAYGLACKHGFTGTEEQWLNSLTAFYLAQQAGFGGTVEEWLAVLNDPVPEIQVGTVTTLPGGSKATVEIEGDKAHPVLHFGIPAGIGADSALSTLGGKMHGALDMDGHGVTGLPDPKEEGDAVPKRYADKIAEAALRKNGGDMVGPLNMYAPINMGAPINMNGFPITGLDAPEGASEPVTLGYAEENYHNYENFTHNSDFTRFVAQAGVGGKHGTQAYAGDRWILDSGSVTGEANSNGEGYRDITLKGTIRQIIANPPAVGTVFVEMASGTAEATYENGEVTVTSDGGVIRNVALYEGEFGDDIRPAYQPVGYSTELARCQRYFVYSPTVDRWSVGFITITGYIAILVPVPVTMRGTPSIVANSAGFKIYTSTWMSLDVTKLSAMAHAGYIVLYARTSVFDGVLMEPGQHCLVNGLPSLSSDL